MVVPGFILSLCYIATRSRALFSRAGVLARVRPPGRTLPYARIMVAVIGALTVQLFAYVKPMKDSYGKIQSSRSAQIGRQNIQPQRDPLSALHRRRDCFGGAAFLWSP